MRLLIFGTDENLISPLQVLVKDCRNLSAFLGDGPASTRGCNLDALWVTPLQAERFGVSPRIDTRTCTISKNTPQMLAKGLPRYVVSCGTTPTAGWLEQAVATLQESVSQFNAEHASDLIKTIGTLPENLGLTNENMKRVVEMLAAALPTG